MVIEISRRLGFRRAAAPVIVICRAPVALARARVDTAELTKPETTIDIFAAVCVMPVTACAFSGITTRQWQGGCFTRQVAAPLLL